MQPWCTRRSARKDSSEAANDEASGNLAIDALNDDGYFVDGGLPNANISYLVKVTSVVDGPYTLELEGNP